MLRFWLVLVGLTVMAGPVLAAETPSPVGRTVEDFTLNDYRGQAHALADLKDAELVVVAFLGTECPLVKLYGPRLAKLHAEYKDRGVAVLGINANRQDSLTEIAAYARVHGLEFPILKDLGNKVADRMGAVRTPEVFVLDEDRVVRYWGRIDDQYGVGYLRDEPTRRDLALALDQLLAGEEVEQPVTESVGCYIGRVREAETGSPVTYSHQIARILQQRCVECHREGEIAPFALTKYDEVAGWADTIAEVVRDGRMPPWHADPRHGTFANDRSLTAREKEQIAQWVAAGAPEGDPAQLPKPREYVSGWQLPREPDAQVYMSEEPHTVPAEGDVKYQYFTVDSGFTEDKWIRGAECLPGNRAVVHHILVMVRPPESKRTPGAGGGEYLAGYVPGLRTGLYPEGMAKLVPAGSKFIFQVHYTPVGSPQQDRSRIGLVFADPDDVTHMVVTSQAVNHRFTIPPHDDNYKIESTSSANPVPVRLLNLMPHMHLRGKSFRYEAVYPDGRRELLLDVPRYDFNWQTAYILAEPKPFPAGTTMHCTAHYDNSEGNLSNPDPRKPVKWGDQTGEEMMIGYFDIAVPRQFMQTAKAEGPRDRNRAERIRWMMNRLDRNRDGKISSGEVPPQARGLFEQADADRSGHLTPDEMQTFVEKLPQRR